MVKRESLVSDKVALYDIQVQKLLLKYKEPSVSLGTLVTPSQMEVVAMLDMLKNPVDKLVAQIYRYILSLQEPIENIGQIGEHRTVLVDATHLHLDAKYTKMAAETYKYIVRLVELMIGARYFGYSRSRKELAETVLAGYPVNPAFFHHELPHSQDGIQQLLARCRLASKKGIVDGMKYSYALPALLRTAPLHEIPVETQLDLIIIAEINRLKPIIQQTRAGILFDSKSSRLINYPMDILNIVLELMEAKEHLVTEEKLERAFRRK